MFWQPGGRLRKKTGSKLLEEEESL
jgi:hypothetical protein